jgi:N-acetyl-gamma-glutamyl-phosphate reductase
MLVSVPLPLTALPGRPSRRDLEAVYADYYRAAPGVRLVVEGDAIKAGRIAAETLRDTDELELYVFGNDRHGQAVLVARLDNLGKGASGAAVQNVRLMLGL